MNDIPAWKGEVTGSCCIVVRPKSIENGTPSCSTVTDLAPPPRSSYI
nr:MAG TPA: hypothetical protein [Crassvirales sp.]